MISPGALAVFFGASLLLALAPGPDNIFVVTQAAIRGRMAGIAVTLGLCTGILVHTSAVALGVAAVFQASELAFTALKLAGAVYLLYLAWQAFRAPASDLAPGRDSGLSRWQYYRRGIIMNITNPKVSIFFLAFLPQFADPAKGSVALQMAVLGLLFMLATILVFGAIALVAGTIGAWLARSAAAQRIMNRIAGTIFAALALRLATAGR